MTGRIVEYHLEHLEDKETSGDPNHEVIANLLIKDHFKSWIEYEKWAKKNKLEYHVNPRMWKMYTNIPVGISDSELLERYPRKEFLCKMSNRAK